MDATGGARSRLIESANQKQLFESTVSICGSVACYVIEAAVSLERASIAPQLPQPNLTGEPVVARAC
jgi:hypothetical protein